MDRGVQEDGRKRSILKCGAFYLMQNVLLYLLFIFTTNPVARVTMVLYEFHCALV